MCSVPHGHWHTTTFLCGLRTSGLVAPLVLDGAIGGDAFLPTSSSSSCRPLRAATSSCSITSARTKSTGYERQSKPSVRPCSTCRPTAPTSTRSNWLSPSSSGCCEKPRPDPSRSYGRQSESCSIASGPAECANYIRHCGFAHSELFRSKGLIIRTARPAPQS